jgi:hypothetical protein
MVASEAPTTSSIAREVEVSLALWAKLERERRGYYQRLTGEKAGQLAGRRRAPKCEFTGHQQPEDLLEKSRC